MPTSTDDQLVLASQRGDHTAFEELVRRLGRWVYARIYLHVRDAHRAEDLTQETFLRAWQSIGQVTDPHGFRAWLATIAANAITTAARAQTRKKRGGWWGRKNTAELDRVPDAAPLPAQSAELTETRDRLLLALAALPEQYREPVTLRYLTGANYEDIGQQLGLTNGSLRGLLIRGMALLREQMTEASDK